MHSWVTFMTHAVCSYNYKHDSNVLCCSKTSNYNAQHDIVYEAVNSYNYTEKAILYALYKKIKNKNKNNNN